jgi:hypothetical protein
MFQQRLMQQQLMQQTALDSKVLSRDEMRRYIDRQTKPDVDRVRSLCAS